MNQLQIIQIEKGLILQKRKILEKLKYTIKKFMTFIWECFIYFNSERQFEENYQESNFYLFQTKKLNNNIDIIVRQCNNTQWKPSLKLITWKLTYVHYLHYYTSNATNILLLNKGSSSILV